MNDTVERCWDKAGLPTRTIWPAAVEKTESSVLNLINGAQWSFVCHWLNFHYVCVCVAFGEGSVSVFSGLWRVRASKCAQMHTQKAAMRDNSQASRDYRGTFLNKGLRTWTCRVFSLFFIIESKFKMTARHKKAQEMFHQHVPDNGLRSR